MQNQAGRAGIGMPDVAIYDAPEVNAFATAFLVFALQYVHQGEVIHQVSRLALADLLLFEAAQPVEQVADVFPASLRHGFAGTAITQPREVVDLVE